MKMAAETTALGKRYRRTWALRDCSLSLPAGRVTALVGPNGAGRTTLLSILDGRNRFRPGRAGRIAAIPAERRVRRAGHSGLHRPSGPGPPAGGPGPQPPVGSAARRWAAGRLRHPARAQGRQAVRRPAGPARAPPGAGPAARAAAARRAAGPAGPGRTARFPRLARHCLLRAGDLGRVLLARPPGDGADRQLPYRAVRRQYP